MPSPTERISARCQLMQLLAQALIHPTQDFYQAVKNCQYHVGVSDVLEALLGRPAILAQLQVSFEDYESQYIALFQLGERGSPAVPLHAGDYDQLLDGQPRTEFMVDCGRWYRHFGLQTQQQQQESTQPDSVVCQLEFMSWLAHLELQVEADSAAAAGYLAAQRDFIERQLRPLLELVVEGLRRETTVRNVTPFFMQICMLALDVCNHLYHELNSVLSPVENNRNQNDDDATEETVNLWG